MTMTKSYSKVSNPRDHAITFKVAAQGYLVGIGGFYCGDSAFASCRVFLGCYCRRLGEGNDEGGTYTR